MQGVGTHKKNGTQQRFMDTFPISQQIESQSSTGRGVFLDKAGIYQNKYLLWL